MGRYGGGRPPKNRWTDKLSDYTVGTGIRAEWQYIPAGAFPERQPALLFYMVLKKSYMYSDDQGVDWKMLNLENGAVYERLWLNDNVTKGHVILTKLTPEELQTMLEAMPKTEANKEWWPK